MFTFCLISDLKQVKHTSQQMFCETWKMFYKTFLDILAHRTLMFLLIDRFLSFSYANKSNKLPTKWDVELSNWSLFEWVIVHSYFTPEKDVSFLAPFYYIGLFRVSVLVSASKSRYFFHKYLKIMKIMLVSIISVVFVVGRQRFTCLKKGYIWRNFLKLKYIFAYSYMQKNMFDGK